MPTDIAEATTDASNGEFSWEDSPPPQLAEGVVQLVNAVVKGVERQIAPSGLITMEFNILKSFQEQDEWTVTQLADLLPADAPRISRLVTKLVERGLLRRRRRTDDRRVVLLRLTNPGQELADELCQRVHQFEARLLAGVSPDDLETVRTVTAKILANNGSAERAPAR